MSAAAGQPGTSDTPAAGTQTADPALTDTPSPSPTRSDGSSDEYNRKIRNDPDFAVSENKSHQSRADKAESSDNATKQWIGNQLRTQYGDYSGDQIAGFLGQFSNLLQHPEAGTTVKKFLETGQWGNGATQLPDNVSGGEDEYKTPEEVEIVDLKKTIATMETRIGAGELGTGKQVLEKHLEEVKKEIALDPTLWDRVHKGLASQIVQWNGNPSGQESIRGLGGPAGLRTIRAMVYAELSPDEISKGHSDAALRTQTELAGLSTGGPLGGASRGQEPPPEFNTPLEAFEWAKNNPGGHDSL